MKIRLHSGFTLIEITLAIAVFAIGIVSLVSLLGFGMDASKDAADDSRAVMIARQIFEDLNIHDNEFSLSPEPGRRASGRPARVLNHFFPLQLPTEENGLGSISRYMAFDGDGNPIPQALSEDELARSLQLVEFDDGLYDDNVAYAVSIHLAPHKENLTKAVVVVEAPGSSPRFDARGRSARRSYQFVSVVSP